jgi:hypothetical protein
MSEKYIEEPVRKTPVIAEADVVVVGGGTAGVTAALAAAKNGAKTILVEQLGHLGGTLLCGGLALHGIYNNYAFSPGLEKVQVVGGLPEMLIQRLVEGGGSFGHVETEINFESEPDIPVADPVILQQVCFDLMREFDVRLFTRTWFADALVESNTLYGIVVESKAGRGAILAKAFVDCTGDGDLAARAGVPFIQDTQLERRYPTGLIFGLGGVDLLRACRAGLEGDYVYRLTRVNKDTPDEIVSILTLSLSKVPGWEEELAPWGIRGAVFGSTRNDVVHYVNSVNTMPGDNLDPEEALQTELELWDKTFALTAFLQRHVPGFEHAFITQFAPLLGARQTRAIECEYEITFDDIRECRSFPDEVARYAYNEPQRIEFQPKDGGSYGIPYRALIPRRIDQLLVAGRMITADMRAHQSTRQTTNCMARGEAAGTAAALAARQGVLPRNLDIKMLQDTLLQNGAILNRGAG